MAGTGNPDKKKTMPKTRIAQTGGGKGMSMMSDAPATSSKPRTKKQKAYTSQRESAEADYKKTGKKSATYKSIEKKGFIKSPPSAVAATSSGGKGSKPGMMAMGKPSVNSGGKGAKAMPMNGTAMQKRNAGGKGSTT